jgi:hypothetical protein
VRHARYVMTFTGAFAALAVSVALPAVSADTLEFVGSTPCDSQPRQFIGVPAASACERITWQLTFFADNLTGRPTTFRLKAIYGMQARSAPGFVDGGIEAELHGMWSILRGQATGSGSTIYRITTDKPQRTLDFVLIGNNLLHPLGGDDALLVGNASWSYTLSRVNAVRDTGRSLNTGLQPVSAKPRTVSSVGSNIVGVFEGRTPCQQLARQLRVAAGSECTKIKWRLTLYQDSAAPASGSYKLEGFVFRNPPRTGRWTIRNGASESDGVVYQLDPDDRGGFLSFFKADENILFMLNNDGGLLIGDVYYSYTLNRTK